MSRAKDSLFVNLHITELEAVRLLLKDLRKHTPESDTKSRQMFEDARHMVASAQNAFRRLRDEIARDREENKRLDEKAHQMGFFR